jgi:hypothetical protein
LIRIKPFYPLEKFSKSAIEKAIAHSELSKNTIQMISSQDSDEAPIKGVGKRTLTPT